MTPAQRISAGDAVVVLGRAVRTALRAPEPQVLPVRGLVVAVDGMTGSGKSWLARQLVEALADLRTGLLEVEALVPGWDGLADGVQECRQALAAMDRGEVARLQTWDWEAMRPGPMHCMALPAGGVLIVEGCGALAAAAQDLEHLIVLRVLVCAPTPLRHARVVERDGYDWDVSSWERQEVEVARSWQGVPAYAPGAVIVPD